MFDRLRANLSMMLAPPKMKEAVQTGMQWMLVPKHSNPPTYGSNELLHSYNSMPWLRAVVGKIGHAVGTTQWKLYVVRDPQSRKIIRSPKYQFATKEQRLRLLEPKKKAQTVFSLEEVESHPLLDLLVRGNERFLGQVVFTLTQQHLDLVGEAFWIMEKNALGVPVAVWPMPPSWVVDLPSRERPYYRVRIDGRQLEIPVTEMLAFVDANPAHPYSRGSGIAQAVGDEIETDEYTAKHLKSFFYNNARPDLIISGEKLSKEDTKLLEERWLQKHQGFWNRFKPHFLNRKVDIKELGQSFESMQMVDLRKLERDIVMQVFGAPPEKFGVLSSSNRSTITASDMFWQKDIILPRVENIRNVLQHRLVPLFDERLILDFESPVVEDKELQLNIMKSQPGAFTRNEWREVADHESLGEDGDVFIMRPGEVVVPMDHVGPIEDPNAPDDDKDVRARLRERIKSAFLQRVKDRRK